MPRQHWLDESCREKYGRCGSSSTFHLSMADFVWSLFIFVKSQFLFFHIACVWINWSKLRYSRAALFIIHLFRQIQFIIWDAKDRLILKKNTNISASLESIRTKKRNKSRMYYYIFPFLETRCTTVHRGWTVLVVSSIFNTVLDVKHLFLLIWLPLVEIGSFSSKLYCWRFYVHSDNLSH